MKVWVNFPVDKTGVAWTRKSGRMLKLINNTEQRGRLFTNINLGYLRKGRCHYIFLNNPYKRPSSKTVGIFVSDIGFRAEGAERFSGKTKSHYGIDGMFGIYDVGTVITDDNGSIWELDENVGWLPIKTVGG